MDLIPNEICMEIFLFLATKDLLSFNAVSKRYHEIIKSYPVKNFDHLHTIQFLNDPDIDRRVLYFTKNYNFKSYKFDYCHIKDEIIKELTNLYKLELILYHITDNAIKSLTNLRYLNLRSDITDDAIENLINLESLELSSVCIKGASLKNLTNLTCLKLRDCINFSESVSLRYLTNLRHLHLSGGCNFNARDLINCRLLRSLDITESFIRNDAFKYLCQHLTNLSKLKLNFCHYITDISPLLNLTKLRILDLSYTPVTNDNLKILTNLHSLSVYRCSLITDDSIKYLTNLHMLDVCHCNITDESLRSLANLTHLILFNTHKISNDMLNSLGQRQKKFKLTIY